MVRAGQLLYKERIKRKLSLDEIAQATKIKSNFLAAIEKGEYSALPSPAYAQGFVSNYAEYLGLPKTEIIALFRREFDEKKVFKVLPDALTKTDDFSLSRVRIQQSLVAVALFMVLIFAYLLFQYRSAFISPYLNVSSPKQSSVTSQEIKVAGKVDSNASVLVNNEPTSVSDSGEFVKIITMFPGRGTVTIKAKNRFGKETVATREIVVK
jgi:cytoskeletal protein RodZ